jgi:hypothetical protein
MSSQTYRTRLTPDLAAQVERLAEQWGISLSHVLRLAVQDLVQHQDRLPGLIVEQGVYEERAREGQAIADRGCYLDLPPAVAATLAAQYVRPR